MVWPSYDDYFIQTKGIQMVSSYSTVTVHVESKFFKKNFQIKNSNKKKLL
jgi:hypothetical protein